MIKVIQGVDLSTYRNELQLNMIHTLKYRSDQVMDMSSEEMLDRLLKHNKAKIIKQKGKVLDPFNKQKHINKQVNKVADPHSTAKIRHAEVTNITKDPSHQKASNPDPIIKPKSTKVHTTVGKDSVKIKSVLSPRALNVKGIMNKFNKASGWTKLTIGFGAALGMSWMANSFNRVRPRFTPTYISRDGLDYRSSSYIPEKYSRGYDTIKESMTDFGSRVRLDKVSSKVNITPTNSTRSHFRTNIYSVTNSNIALNAHNNAIKHTRY